MTKLVLLILGLVAILHLGAAGQAPDTEWVNLYTLHENQLASGVCELNDGYAIVGADYLPEQGNYYVALTKIDEAGSIIWKQYFGGNLYDYGSDVLETSDGGLVIVGTRQIFSEALETFLIKTDENGNRIWQRGYQSSGDNYGYKIHQMSNGDFIIAGLSDVGFDAMAIRTDLTGNLIWMRTYHGENDGQEEALDICESTDGGIALVGYQEIDGANAAWWLKLNDQGDTLQSRIYGEWGSNFHSIAQTYDGFILAGRQFKQQQGTFDIFIVKINSWGDTIWTRTFGGQFWDEAFSVQPDINGEYFIGAMTCSDSTTNAHFYFLKVNAFGDLLWSRTVGSPYEDPSDAIICGRNGYLMVGNSYRYDDNDYDVFAAKLAREQRGEINNDVNLPGSFYFYPAYPNPFNAQTTIQYDLVKDSPVTISIFNIMGQRIATLVNQTRPAGHHQVIWNAGDISSGIYFYKISAGDYNETKKMLLLK